MKNADAFIGKVVVAAKKRAGIKSYRQLARESGISQTQIMGIVHGNLPLSDSFAAQLEKALGKNNFNAEKVVLVRTRRNIRRVLKEE